jgi:hypothetical protein
MARVRNGKTRIKQKRKTERWLPGRRRKDDVSRSEIESLFAALETGVPNAGHAWLGANPAAMKTPGGRLAAELAADPNSRDLAGTFKFRPSSEPVGNQ